MLKFATGQDSYLNKDSSIATDNRDYQALFGGEAMLTSFEVPAGESILDMFTPENQQKMIDLQAQLADTPGVLNAVTPLSALQWTNNLVTAPEGQPPTASPAGGILQRSIAREEPGSDAAAARLADSVETLTRVAAARRAVPRQPGLARVPAHRQPRRDPARAAAVLPRTAG